MTREELEEFENQLIRETRTSMTMDFDTAERMTKLGIKETVAKWKDRLEQQPCEDTISRQAAIDAILRAEALVRAYGYRYAADAVRELPPVQPEKETAKRVLWTGWKGTRDTRYKCPNCKKPVKNDDVYCHRCGQKLMFPHISFTDYIPGEKQELIVRWDDE